MLNLGIVQLPVDDMDGIECFELLIKGTRSFLFWPEVEDLLFASDTILNEIKDYITAATVGNPEDEVYVGCLVGHDDSSRSW